MKTVVFTSDTHSWLLRGFFHQWQKYGNDWTIQVAGFTHPGTLPEGVDFYSIGEFKDYPADKWSDAIIKYLENQEDELFLFMLEDYWLLRQVNQAVLDLVVAFMNNHPEVGRFDVAADRVFDRAARYVGSVGIMDICEAKGNYSLSFQASIYRRKALLDALRPGESPWQSELKGTYRMNSLHWKVAGTYQWPINYMIVMNKGRLDLTGAWMYPARCLNMMDLAELGRAGCLNPEGEKALV